MISYFLPKYKYIMDRPSSKDLLEEIQLSIMIMSSDVKSIKEDLHYIKTHSHNKPKPVKEKDKPILSQKCHWWLSAT